jgi:hypothetical protein
MDAEAFWARTKGKVRYVTGSYNQTNANWDVDLNSQLGLPDHEVLGTFSITYRFKPRWSMTYSITPIESNGSGTFNNTNNYNIVFGRNNFNSGQNTRVKFERLIHNASFVYEPLTTYRSRLGVYGGYTRVDDKLSVIQVGCCSDAYDASLNMGYAGLEVERCLRTARYNQVLSLVCKAGVAFGDDGLGTDVTTGLKYSIPMRKGRWGFVSGGYKYATYKKKYSDYKELDTSMEGGFLKMGFIF